MYNVIKYCFIDLLIKRRSCTNLDWKFLFMNKILFHHLNRQNTKHIVLSGFNFIHCLFIKKLARYSIRFGRLWQIMNQSYNIFTYVV